MVYFFLETNTLRNLAHISNKKAPAIPRIQEFSIRLTYFDSLVFYHGTDVSVVHAEKIGLTHPRPYPEKQDVVVMLILPFYILQNRLYVADSSRRPLQAITYKSTYF